MNINETVSLYHEVLRIRDRLCKRMVILPFEEGPYDPEQEHFIQIEEVSDKLGRHTIRQLQEYTKGMN